MRNFFIISLAAALLSLPASPAGADDKIVVKLGTSAPLGSPWHINLKEAANKWREISGGRVELRIFAGGTMGDEGDMVQKMRIGQLQAAGLSTIGLHQIAKEAQAIDMPLIVKNYEERDYLLQKMAPKLDKAMAEKGFSVLAWSEIGFTYFFSNQPRPTLPEMRQAKLFCWSGDPDSKDAWVAGGFSPVVLSAIDMFTSLQTKIIDTVVYTRTLVLNLRVYSKAKYMMDLPYSTLTGATVIDKKVWDKIPPEMHEPLKKVFVDLGIKGTETARQMEDQSLEKLKSLGVEVVHVTDEQAWHDAVKAVRGSIRGKVVPAETFDEVLATVAEYRKKKGTH